MPRRPPRPCSHPGCGRLTDTGRCELHPHQHGWAPDSERGTRQQRGYGREWERIRVAILRRDRYLCQCEECKAGNRLTVAHEVDHRIPKARGGTDDPDNLRAINRDCHRRKTAREGRGGSKNW